MVIRDATPVDFASILALNEESVAVLSPLTDERLSHLHNEAAFHRVVEQAGTIVAFLLALREGSAYDSPNYVWFRRNFDRFLYIDRIVVSRSSRVGGMGTLLYRDLFAFATRESVPTVTCEFDVDPLNAASERFHSKFGFREVGRQIIGAGRKLVSLQAVSLTQDNQTCDTHRKHATLPASQAERPFR